MATKGGFAQDCYRIFEIDEPESVPDGKNLEKNQRQNGKS